jgi:hypothetical protein
MEKLQSPAPTGYDVGNCHSSATPSETFREIPTSLF